MATLSLQIPQPSVSAGVAFPGTVTIAGAPPNATVQVALTQCQGTGTWTSGATAVVNSLGSGIASFPAITLAGSPHGPEIATLVANATDNAGDFFWSDAKSVQVI